MRSFFKRFSFTGKHEEKKKEEKKENVMEKYVFKEEVEEKALPLKDRLECDEFFFGACFQGNVNMLRKYFDASTDIDKKRARILSKDSSDRTALHFACDSGALDVVQLLISNGAIESICVFDSDGCTPLHRAVRNGSSDVVKFLLEAQKKHNKKYLPIVLNAITSDTTKRTALHIAALERKHEIAKLLLQYGADKNMKDKFGNEPKAYGLVQFDEGGSSEHHDCCIPGKGGKQYRSG